MDGGLDSGTNPLADLLSATLSMSWQLAIVVLVPIIGGYELDKKLHTLPLLTVIGFIVAATGMALVVWRQLQLIAPLASPPKEHRS
jgi:F0F1-type ATP synthase assembly protein I